MRALVIASAFMLTAAACAADDVPKPPTEDQRAAIAKEWRAEYDRLLAELKLVVEDCNLRAKATGNAADIAAANQANALYAKATKDPMSVGVGVLHKLADKCQTGQAGPVAQPSLSVGAVDKDGVVLEGVVAETSTIVRYFFPVPPKGANKKGAKVNVSGWFYVAGTVERGGRTLPVLYPFELKKDELPPPPKK